MLRSDRMSDLSERSQVSAMLRGKRAVDETVGPLLRLEMRPLLTPTHLLRGHDDHFQTGIWIQNHRSRWRRSVTANLTSKFYTFYYHHLKKLIIDLNNDKSSMICLYNQFSFDRIESFLESNTSLLHPNHYVFTKARRSLNKLYGSDPLFIGDLSLDLLQRKIDICRELLSIDDVLQPGLTCTRGSFKLTITKKKNNNTIIPTFLTLKTDSY